MIILTFDEHVENQLCVLTNKMKERRRGVVFCCIIYIVNYHNDMFTFQTGQIVFVWFDIALSVVRPVCWLIQ